MRQRPRDHNVSISQKTKEDCVVDVIVRPQGDGQILWCCGVRCKTKKTTTSTFGKEVRRRAAHSRNTSVTNIIFFLFVIYMTISLTAMVVNAGVSDPFHVLGVARNATPKEIQKQYRKLCLKYHPDKTMKFSPPQRKKYEAKFKQVQEAYAMIGEHRPGAGGYGGEGYYRSSATGRPQSTPYGSDPVAEAFFRAFDRNGAPPSSSQPRSSYFFSRPYTPFGFRTGFPSSTSSPPMMPAELSFKSIYVQKVKVPLETLYKGATEYRLYLQDNLWTRYRAAARGKILYLSLYQGMLYSIPILRLNKVLATIIGLFIVHSTLPRPDPQARYSCNLRPGTKGARVKFTSTRYGQPEVIFELEAAEHPLYYRLDDNLHTEILISDDDAKYGCKGLIDALDPTEDPIEFVIPSKQYSYQRQKANERGKYHHQQQRHNNHDDHTPLGSTTGSRHGSYSNTIRVRGRGWPTKNGNNKGDVVIAIKVKPPSKKSHI